MNPFNPNNPSRPSSELCLPFSVGEGISFSPCPYGDTKITPGDDGQVSGLGDILKSHTKPSTPKLVARAPTLLHKGRGTTFDLPVLDMKGNTHDEEKHVKVSKVQQLFRSHPLSAMGSLPSLGEIGMAPVLGTPDLWSFSVPDSSKPGSAAAHKVPNVQVRAPFGTNKCELETLDPETRQVMKDLLKRPVFSGD